MLPVNKYIINNFLQTATGQLKSFCASVEVNLNELVCTYFNLTVSVRYKNKNTTEKYIIPP